MYTVASAKCKKHTGSLSIPVLLTRASVELLGDVPPHPIPSCCICTKTSALWHQSSSALPSAAPCVSGR